MAKLTFGFFRAINTYRCRKAFGRQINEWSPAEWACALAGEVGELCNKIKKQFRDGQGKPLGDVDKKAIEDEIADVFCYLDLLAARYGVDLESVVIRKFNEVSRRRGHPEIVIQYPERSPILGETTETIYTFEPRESSR